MLKWRHTVVEASDKGLLASQNLMLQPLIRSDLCKEGVPVQQVGGLPEPSDCQMNGSVFSLSVRSEVVNAFDDVITCYWDGCCVIVESPLCRCALISLCRRQPRPSANMSFEITRKELTLNVITY
uniref:Uncharacterized protein n=1 Tax=Molossus molossus TaxID=27622 RepID=A0A7J8BYD5_MOLMO|nr:hypothetical protein HJG59_010027 [Molossus molossus]